MSNAAPTTDLPPHPQIVQYYRTNLQKRAFLRDIFDETAEDYDRVERLLALGSGPWYRRQALRRAGLAESMRVLDVASGTGLVAREAIGLVGACGQVVGIDPSIGMLRQARSLDGLSAVLGVGESLPFADASFDFLSMGYALRHLPDLRAAFAEFHRVLRPGGRICLLEISRPAGIVSRAVVGAYFKVCLPMLARAIGANGRTQRLWQYYWQTIDQCVPADVVVGALHDAGFDDARRHLSLGLFSEFIATRPASA